MVEGLDICIKKIQKENQNSLYGSDILHMWKTQLQFRGINKDAEIFKIQMKATLWVSVKF